MPYQGRQPGVGVRNRFIFTATSGQTSFSGADSNGLTLKYPDATYTDVFLNGVLLIPVTDYAATTKTSIVLSSGAAASDVLEVVAYEIASIANTVPTSGGTFTGPLTVEGNFTADGGTIKLDGNYPVGTGNVALGDAAGAAITSGGRNTLIGGSAGDALTVGQRNVVVGTDALSADTQGSRSVAIGQAALANQNFTSATDNYNVAVGFQAGVNVSTGTNNTLIGGLAGDAITTGGYNVAVGATALTANTTASFNTAVGYQAAYSNTTGADNTAMGTAALYPNTTGNYNAAFGSASLRQNTTGSFNTALGQSALNRNTTASNNTAVGYQASFLNTTGTENTAVGYVSMYSNTTGNYNTAYGRSSLPVNQTGSNNVAVGWGSLNFTTSSDNTAVGYQAGYSRTGSGNTCVGNYSGRDGTTGTDNTFVGRNSGYTITSGSKNTIIGMYNGNQGGLDIRTSSNNIVLSDGDGNPWGHRSGSGQWNLSGFGGGFALQVRNTQTSNPSGQWTYFSATAPANTSDYFHYYSDSSAVRCVIWSNGNVVNINNSYGAISDVKLKENIVDASSQWDDIKNLTVRKYSMKADSLDAPNMLGVIAQELEAADMAGLVTESPDRDSDMNDLGTVTKQVNYSILYMKAVKALQEAMTRIEALETKVTALEGA